MGACAGNGRSPTHPECRMGYAVLRWAHLVVRTIDSPSDPRTETEWGRAVGASVGVLRSRCRAIEVSTKGSLELARILRVLIVHRGETWDPANALDVIDPRTLAGLLQRAGLAGVRPGSCAPSPGTFLASQRFVTRQDAITAIACLLRRQGVEPTQGVSPTADGWPADTVAGARARVATGAGPPARHP